MSGAWIAVASAEHVALGRAGGFMQVCHGKAAPLRRIKPGDRVVYYSPTLRFREPGKLQAFTAIGIVREGAPYQHEMAPGFCPFRRDVRWFPAQEAPMAPLLAQLEFAAGRRSGGAQLRFGLVAIGDHDVQGIAAAMGVQGAALRAA